MDKANATITQLKNLPQPVYKESWAKGALKRGFYSAVQCMDATSLSVIMLAPKTSRALGFDWLTGGREKLIARISDWERRIENNDIEPLNPSYLKSGLSFLLFNAAYLSPIIAGGYAAGLAGGTMTALIIAGLLNTHATMGESFIQTARARTQKVEDRNILNHCLEDRNFCRAVNLNVAIRGSICLAFTVAAGPLARLMGGFTAGAVRSLARTPLGGLLTDQVIKAGHKSAIKSVHKPLGKTFADVANHGPGIMLAKITGAVIALRASTAKAASWVTGDPSSEQAAEDPDNNELELKQYSSPPETKSHEVPPLP